MSALYETDVFTWVEQQVAHLKAKEWDKLDLENLIDEVESVTKSNRRSMRSYFEVLITHMLKWNYQPSMRSNSWKASIVNCQNGVNGVIEENPGLKPTMKEQFDLAFKNGLKIAIIETGMKKNDFPDICPWSMKECLNFEIED